MENNNTRNHPAYAILESYAHDETANGKLDENVKEHIFQLARENPEVWKVAKEDFELYKYW